MSRLKIFFDSFCHQCSNVNIQQPIDLDRVLSVIEFAFVLGARKVCHIYLLIDWLAMEPIRAIKQYLLID